MAAIRRWGPWGDLLSLQEKMNKILEETVSRVGTHPQSSPRWTPPVDIYEREDSFVLEIDLPGVPLQSVEVEVKDEALHVRGRRSPDDDAPSAHFLRQERLHGDFHRVFSLPLATEREKVNAKLKNGVLTVTIPKQETTRPRQITVEDVR